MPRGITYLDSSALVKLVVAEQESRALSHFLDSRPDRVSSVIARVEVTRALRRATLDTAVLERGQDVLRRVALVDITDSMLEVAGRIEPTSLRSLDSIHLSAASLLGEDLSDFVTYDTRLRDGATDLGLPNVVAPD